MKENLIDFYDGMQLFNKSEKDTAKYFEKVNFALNSFKDRFVPQH